MLNKVRGGALAICLGAAVVLGFGCLIRTPGALAQSRDQQWSRCENQDRANAFDLIITACTNIIQSGGGNLAVAFVDRGNAFLLGPLHDYSRAIADYTRATALNPQFAEAFYDRGEAYRMQRDYGRAITDFTEAIRLNPRYGDAFYQRGNSYLEGPKADYRRAIADYNQAVALNPLDAHAFNNRGTAYQSGPQPDYAQAIADYTQAIALNPQYAEAFNNRGLARAQRQPPEYAAAVADYTEAIAINPRLADAFYNRGNAYRLASNHDYDRAIADYDHAAALEPANANYQTGRCLGRAIANRDLVVALAACDAGLRLSPNDDRLLDCRGLVELRQQDWQAAWNDYNAATQANAALAVHLYGRGIAALRLGRGPEGRMDLAGASQLDPNIAQIYAGYGIRP